MMKFLCLTTLVSFLVQVALPKASISGVVVREGTNEPLSEVRVSLYSNGDSNNLKVISGGDGRFFFNDLEPGQYKLQFDITGYLTQYYGERIFDGSSTSIPLRAGGVVNNIVMRMTPFSAISGRIRDESFQPLVGVPVRIFRYVYREPGRRGLQFEFDTDTNDRGEYRLYGIRPGPYYLQAGGRPLFPFKWTDQLNINEVVSEEDPVFYPGTPTLNHATLLEIEPGSDRKGVDFILVRRQNRFQIRGHVKGIIDSGLMVEASSLEPRALIDGSGDVDLNTGLFEIDGLVPGEYRLSASSGTRSAMLSVQLGEGDLTGVELPMRETGTLSASVMLDGKPFPPATGNVIYLTLRDTVTGFYKGATTRETPFVVESLPAGTYRVLVRNLPSGVYLKSATYGNADALNDGMNFDPAKASTLQLQMSPKPAALRGIVRNARSEASSRVAVVLVPDRFRDRNELYSAILTNEDGEFEFKSVAPGRYKVFAWESIEAYSWLDPNVLAQFEEKGESIQLEESAKKNIELRVISAEARR